MARIKYSSIVSEVSGSVGGVTFQKSAFGNILRSKPRHRLTGSALQMTRRSQMMQIHKAWHDLSDINRSSWNHFMNYSSASIRREKKILLTGHSLFIQYNYLRLITGLSLLTTIGYNTLAEFPKLTYIYNTGGVLSVDFDSDFHSTISWFVLKLSIPRIPSIAANSQGCRYMFTCFKTNYTFTFETSYLAQFGALPVNGDTIHYVLRHFSIPSPVLSGIYVGKITLAPPP